MGSTGASPKHFISSLFHFQEWPAADASRKAKQVRQAGSTAPTQSLLALTICS